MPVRQGEPDVAGSASATRPEEAPPREGRRPAETDEDVDFVTLLQYVKARYGAE
jgi:hypothetical protein